MKVKFTILIVLSFFILIGSGCHAAVTTTGFPAAPSDTTHNMLHPDANTKYLDTAGHQLDSVQFMNAMKTGGYTFEPDMKNGKVLSIKLKATVQKVKMGAKAPEFSGTDLKGNAVSLKALRGKTVILNFWFTSCAPCLAEIPELNNLVAKYKDDSSVTFLALTYNSPEDVNNFLKHKDFKFNIVAGRSDIIDQYGIAGYPTSIVIDKEGNVVFLMATYDGTNVQQLDGVIGALKNVK